MKWRHTNSCKNIILTNAAINRNENVLYHESSNIIRTDSTLDAPNHKIGPAKLWGVSDEQKDDSNKGIFNLGDQSWRETPWNADQSVSQPITLVPRRSATFPSGNASADVNSVMSPRSESSGLGMKMVEYVLGTSPTTKDILETRMRLMDLNVAAENDAIEKTMGFENSKGDTDTSSTCQNNCMLQNGLQDDDKTFNRTPGSRQPSPTKEEQIPKNSHVSISHVSKVDDLVANSLVSTTTSLDGCSTSMVEPTLIDPISYFENAYSLMPPVESAGSLLTHGLNSQQPQQHLYRNNHQPSLQVLAQQQQYVQGQQLGIPSGPYPSSPYVINPQEPYLSTLIASPAMVPPYYGMTPWGMYSANLIQQGTPQQRRSMPSSQTNEVVNHNGLPQFQEGQYQVIPAYYDQNGSFLMGNPRAPNGTPLRLISPTPVIINAGALNGGQQLSTNPAAAALYNTSAPNSLYTPPSSSVSGIGGLQAPNNAHLSAFNNLGLPQGSALGYGGLGNSTTGRRDSFDRNSSGFSPSLDYRSGKWLQNYNALGSLGISGSSTPPPLSNSPSLPLGHLMGVGTNRVLPATPGRLWGSHLGSDCREWGTINENRLRNGGLTNGIMGLNSMLPTWKHNTVIDKPVGRSRLLEDFRAYTLTERGKGVLSSDEELCSGQWGLDAAQHDVFADASRNRYPNLQLRDLANHIVEFSQDQHGSRFIQLKLERATPAEKEMVFSEVLTAAYNLMTDVFGNYVIQKFFEFGTLEQRNILVLKISGQVLPLALQMYGCRVIQKALECTTAEQQKDIARELDGHVIRCVKDQNGNHVVQKCIESVEPSALQFIIDAFQSQVLALSTHPYGCRVIQRILEHCNPEQTRAVLEELHQNSEHLIQDQYGNYVVQHVLENGKPEDRARIVTVVRGKVLQLSQHKFASNVVESSVAHASRADRASLVEEVCNFADGPHSGLHTMMKDQFANYVIQKMLDVAEPAQRKVLMQKIRPYVPALRKYTYGKHIISKLEKYYLKNGATELNPIVPLGGTTTGL